VATASNFYPLSDDPSLLMSLRCPLTVRKYTVGSFAAVVAVLRAAVRDQALQADARASFPKPSAANTFLNAHRDALAMVAY
jgi:hypothetical protein